ncbi:MAG: phage tail sheath subtilisin-like domain-containing protein [Chloroflexi bacterium]|nr:phage tail sheath subtilisin-like domain-containing protein [Chloroflexota bacterium]
MAETFTVSEFVVPGVFVRVRAEGLITPGGVPTGNIGIVGTARRLDENGDPVDIYDSTLILSEYEAGREQLGRYDRFAEGTLNLSRGLELAYLNGARTVFARALAPGAGRDAYIAAFNELAKDDVNILVAPELTTSDALAVFGAVLETAENNGKDIIALVGSDAVTVQAIAGQVVGNDRIILIAPGVRVFDSAEQMDVTLRGTYAAAAMAGLLSTLSPQSSPTNKVLPGIVRLSQRFSYGEIRQLVSGRVCVLEERRGVRVVRGITMDDGAFQQITTRRIVDLAKAGIRQASNPFIGRLNNQRVRAALQGAIDGFLTTMVQDEALTGYTVQVTATRQDEIAGRAVVNAVVQPTFSIDFVAVTLVLQ